MRKVITIVFFTLIVASLFGNAFFAFQNFAADKANHWDIACLFGAPVAAVSALFFARGRALPFQALAMFALLGALITMLPSVVLTGLFETETEIAALICVVVGFGCGWLVPNAEQLR